MQQSPFENQQDHFMYFSTPQLDDLLQSILTEIKKLRPVSCIIGFPESGKSSFLRRLESILEHHTILIPVSPGCPLAKTLHQNPTDPNNIVHTLKSRQRVIVLLDNAHLLTDQDFAYLTKLLNLAQTHAAQLQFVLIGNGEIVHRLARPSNRPVYLLLGTLWNLPKLTREQSLAYIAFLLDSGGMSQDIILHPEALAQRAAGIVGTLRSLTTAMVKQALETQESCDAQKFLNTRLLATEHTDTTEAETTRPVKPSPFRQILSLVIVALALAALWLTFGPDRSPVTSPALIPETNSSAPEISPRDQSKTVLRKRTNAGPYCLQLGAYPSLNALLEHLPRLARLGQPLLWNQGSPTNYALFIGRFASAEEAENFAAQHSLGSASVAWLPFVVTVGPLTESSQVLQANALLGLPEKEKNFEQELVSGVEIQFALEASEKAALDHCQHVEQKGLSCAVTQYQ